MILLLLAACFLAYANGANDNFKGVASLYGSRTASYSTALGWATLTTFAGSLASIFLAGELLKKFSGKGLVPDSFAASEHFLLAVVIGAALTVILATFTGFPVSTTHGLIGAIVGCGMIGSHVAFAALGKSFVVPLLLSPVMAIAAAGIIYVLLRLLRLQLGIGKEWCLCAGEEMRVIPVPAAASVLTMDAVSPGYTVSVGETEECSTRYAGTCVGIRAQHLMDVAHFLSAGVVCFARSLNDTPKIAAMLLLVKFFDIRWGFALVAIMMVIGGLLHSRRIAETMSKKIAGMNHGQGLSANLSTGLLVILASVFGLPVSTTHVAVGSIYGIGVVTRQANSKVMIGIVLSWLITLPCAAVLAALAYVCITKL
jgi:PiT family inorganic phosphate transporter